MTRILLSPAMQAPATRQVFDALHAKGGVGCVRFVGGCVRNALLDVPASDLDLATQLLPDETEAALDAVGIDHVPTGKAFGTITALCRGDTFEITSLREDVETDGRRAVVSFTTDWAQDAQRRDFYVNALYADSDGQVFDPTGQGLGDITARRVRFIGEAAQRIREDYLRILRFFRFSAGYAAQMDAESLDACLALKAGIDGLSGERIWAELIKTLGLASPLAALEAMQTGGVLAHILPGWFKLERELSEVAAMIRLSTDPQRRLMALIDTGLGLTAETLTVLHKRLRFSQAIRDRLLSAGEVAGQLHATQAGDMARLVYRHGRQAVEDAVLLIAAHENQTPDTLLALIAGLEVPAFPLRGADLIARGMVPGPEVGQRLKHIEQAWLDHDFSQSVIDDALAAI